MHIILILFLALFSPSPFFCFLPSNLLFWLPHHLTSRQDADGSTNVVADYSKLTSLFPPSPAPVARLIQEGIGNRNTLKTQSIQSFNHLIIQSFNTPLVLKVGSYPEINRAYQSTRRLGASRDSLGCSRPQERNPRISSSFAQQILRSTAFFKTLVTCHQPIIINFNHSFSLLFPFLSSSPFNSIQFHSRIAWGEPLLVQSLVAKSY